MNSIIQKRTVPLEEIRQSLMPDWSSFFSRGSFGALDVDQQEEQMVISVDLPGVKEEDIDITYKDNRLLLSASRQEERASENGYLHAERSWGQWDRSLYLPGLDPDAIKATLKEGVLTLVCQSVARKGKHIEIASGE